MMGMHPLCCMPTKGASAAARQSAATASALFANTGDGQWSCKNAVANAVEEDHLMRLKHYDSDGYLIHCSSE